MNCNYFMQSCLTWVLNNKIVTLLSLLSFCLFVSTLAMAGQRNRLNDRLVACQNSIANVESTTENAVASTTESEETTTVNTETTISPEIETTTAATDAPTQPPEIPGNPEESNNEPSATDPQANPDDENGETNAVQPNTAVVKNEIIDEQYETKLPDDKRDEESEKTEAAVAQTPEQQAETAPAVDIEPEKQVAMRKKRDTSDTYDSALINRILALATAS